MALEWCTSGMAPGSAVLVAMGPSKAACGVVRLGDDGRLRLESTREIETAPAGGALRYGLADVARHVIGCHLVHETKVQNVCR